MLDITNLLVSKFICTWDEEPMVVYAGFLHHGEIKIIVSKNGGPLYEANVNELRPAKGED